MRPCLSFFCNLQNRSMLSTTWVWTSTEMNLSPSLVRVPRFLRFLLMDHLSVGNETIKYLQSNSFSVMEEKIDIILIKLKRLERTLDQLKEDFNTHRMEHSFSHGPGSAGMLWEVVDLKGVCSMQGGSTYAGGVQGGTLLVPRCKISFLFQKSQEKNSGKFLVCRVE